MMSADVSTPCDSPASSTAAAAATSPSSYVPERMERHLQSVDMSASGRMLLGATSLSSEHWTGSLWLFDDPSAAPDLRRCLTGLDLEDGLCEALFLDGEGEQVAAAMQSGAVEFYKLSVSDEDPKAPPFKYLERTTSVREHDDAITAMRMASGGNALLTASYDRSVVCLDSATTAVKRRWDRAHDDVILDLVTEGSSNLFATAAQDGRVALWDDRESKCQKCLYKDLDAAPSCLAWSPINKDRLVVGDVSGRLLVLDSRQMADPLNIVKVSQQRIYKIKFSTHKPEFFSLICDARTLRIFSMNDVGDRPTLMKRHEDAAHTDFVRGMSWRPGTEEVWTCGWDKRVARHCIAPPPTKSPKKK